MTSPPSRAVLLAPPLPVIILGAILGCAFLARAFIALTMTPWQAPDEPKHFEYIRVLVDLRDRLWSERRLPTIDDAEPGLQRMIIVSLAENGFWDRARQPTPAPLPTRFIDVWPPGAHTQLHRPSLYYYLAAPFLLPFSNASLTTQLLVTRLVSAACSALTVVVVYLVARTLIRDDPFVPLVSAAFVAALPMHVYIGGAVNNDNLVTLVGSLLVLALLQGLRRGFTLKIWLSVVLALVVGLATKRVMVGLLPAVVLAGMFWLASLDGRRLAAALSGVALCGVLVLNLLGPGIGLGWLPLQKIRDAATAYALNSPDQLDRLLDIPFASGNAVQLVREHLTALFMSFWGFFGWFSLPLSMDLYGLLGIATAVCFVGFMFWLGGQIVIATRMNAPIAWVHVIIALVMLVAIVAMVILAEGERLAYYKAGEIPQGRYLFVVIAPIAVVMAIGARVILPRRLLGTWVPVGIVFVGLLILDVTVYLGFLHPFFRAFPPA